MTQQANEDELLQEEAERARYALRSSFYYRMHGSWDGLLELLTTVKRPSWRGRTKWGISRSAWNRINDIGESPINVFCNPAVIRVEPRLIAYYRCLALLPQKGIETLAFSTADLERGRGQLNVERSTLVAVTVNNLICALLDSDPEWELEKGRTAALLNLGSQINGSWRNAIGTEGGRRVKQILMAFAAQWEIVDKITLNDGSVSDFGPHIDEQLIKELRLTNGFSIAFSSEPDVAVRNEHGDLIATIEVKYGLDPAGALERYGAAKKSFEEAIRENARVANVYLASCITDEVRRRISEDRVVNRDINLTEVLNDSARRTEFMSYIRRLLEL